MHSSQDGTPLYHEKVADYGTVPSRVPDFSTTSQESQRQLWLPVPKDTPRKYSQALADPCGDFDRAGRPSWGLTANKPIGRRPNLYAIQAERLTGPLVPNDNAFLVTPPAAKRHAVNKRLPPDPLAPPDLPELAKTVSSFRNSVSQAAEMRLFGAKKKRELYVPPLY